MITLLWYTLPHCSQMGVRGAAQCKLKWGEEEERKHSCTTPNILAWESEQTVHQAQSLDQDRKARPNCLELNLCHQLSTNASFADAFLKLLKITLSCLLRTTNKAPSLKAKYSKQNTQSKTLKAKHSTHENHRSTFFLSSITKNPGYWQRMMH